ncbi:MAG: sulfite exporter TauE/SafE family protein [Thermoanaerobaculia bacterium]
MSSYPLLALAAFLAGSMNAVAGGGSFLTFPALVFSGVPSIIANASSTVALFPGSFASAWGYRESFQKVEGVSYRTLLAVSMAGGVTGALLLLTTRQQTFDRVVPWLLMMATILFALGSAITRRLKESVRIPTGALLVMQYLVGIYGGYFGGAVGILMLAVLSLYGLTDIHAMNAGKTLLVGAMNAVAVVCFVIAGKVWWAQTLVMLVAAVAGGYAGARVAQRVDPRILRAAITLISIGMTVAFFLRR